MQCGNEDPIVIVGAACRLPGEASSIDGLWDMIKNGRSAHAEVPPNRWDANMWTHPDPDRKGTLNVGHGYFLKEDTSHFDAPFFSTTAKEAAAMDPMKRLLLEVSYESFENAGIPIQALKDTYTGCYVGCMTNDYEMLSTGDVFNIGHNAAAGTSEAMTANRVSWFFGLRGPSLTLDTACSSSLYALHLACQSLKLQETEMALVAGVNLIHSPMFSHQLTAMHMLSPDGISHSFDDRANGYARGEGIGAVVVKRLSDALRDGNTIRAVIRGTGTNADGKTPGLTQPSSEAQADLIRRTYAAAGLGLQDTQYVECHGTGTPIGDPIELLAIGSTLGAARATSGRPLFIGSIKPNVGHTEGCAGLAGIFKALLSLEKGVIPPTIGIEKLNPKLRLSDWNLSIPQECVGFPTTGQRRISVNSFGFGGANAHVVLDDACNYLRNWGFVGGKHATAEDSDLSSESGISVGTRSPPPDGSGLVENKKLFVFSSRDQGGISRAAERFATHLQGSSKDQLGNEFLDNLAYTLSDGRSQFEFRSFALAASVPELCTSLRNGLPKASKRAGKHDNLVFVFTGQGAQWPTMGQELLSNPVFRESINSSQGYLTEAGCKWNLVAELQKPAAESNIDLSEYSQTLCTALQVALVDLLRHWGIKPKATVGHSSGEIVAAYASGNLSHRDSIRIAYFRGICSSKVESLVQPRIGSMLAAGVSPQEAVKYLSQVPLGSAVLACINSPQSVTLSGDLDAIEKLENALTADARFARKLRVKTAYHSSHMQTVSAEYLSLMGTITPRPESEQTAVMFSSVTGEMVTSSKDLGATYWTQNMCQCVQFSSALDALLQHSQNTQPAGRSVAAPTRWSAILEVGPSGALKGPVGQVVASCASKAAKEAPYLAVLTRGKNAEETALGTAGQLWATGHGVALSKVNDQLPALTMLPSLPSYAWNHSKGFWHESLTSRSNRFPPGPRTDLLGAAVDLQNADEPSWTNWLRVPENPWIEDHKITGTVLYPGAGMLIMALEAASKMADGTRKVDGFRLSNISFERGLSIPSSDDVVQTQLGLRKTPNRPGSFDFTLYSVLPGGTWTRHCHGSVEIEYENNTSESEVECRPTREWDALTAEYEAIQKACTMDIPTDSFYDGLEEVGVEYGPTFRNVVSLSSAPSLNASHGIIVIPDTKSGMPAEFEFPHLIHPATMDAIFHLLFAAFAGDKPVTEAAVPFTLESMFVAASQPHGAGAQFRGFAKLARTAGRETAGDMVISDDGWTGPKLVVKNFALRQVTSSASAALATSRNGDKCARMEWAEDVDFILTPTAIRTLRAAKGPAEGSIEANLLNWIERLCHKKAGVEALLLVQDASSASIAVLQRVLGLVGSPKGLAKCITVVASDEMAIAIRSRNGQREDESGPKVWDPAGDAAAPLEGVSFDLAIVLGGRASEKLLSTLGEQLRPPGHLVFFSHPASVRDEIKFGTFARRIDVSAKTEAGENGQMTIMTSSSMAPELSSLPADVVYLLRTLDASADCHAITDGLSKLLLSAGINAKLVTLAEVEQLSGQHVISLLEIERPFVYGWDEKQFGQFKRLVTSARHILWLTRGGLLSNWGNGGLEFAPTQGLLRVLRNEYSQIELPHFDLSRQMDLAAAGSAKLVFDVWCSSVAPRKEMREMELAESDGAVFVPRAVQAPGLDLDLGLKRGNAKPVPGPLHCGKALRLCSAPGIPELAWVDSDDPGALEEEEEKGPLEEGQVEIQVQFVGLNASDTLVDASGSGADAPVGLGHEAVGVVSRLGPGVKTVVVGQTVALLKHHQSCQTVVRQDQSLVQAVPGNVSPQDAAGLSRVFIAAQYSLLDVARLEEGQTILIHGAAGGLGQAAIQIAQSVGATVFATISSGEKRDMLVRRYGLSPACIFDSQRRNFVAAITSETGGRGVDVILHSRSGSGSCPLAVSATCLAETGVVLDLSHSVGGFNLPPSKRNASVARIDLAQVEQAKPELVKTLFRQTFELIRAGKAGALSPTAVVPVTEAKEALARMKTRDHYGKFVLSLQENVQVPMLLSSVPELKLDPRGTYILSGGLGALGLKIADMMLQHGAGHIVFLSRSGGSKNQTELDRFTSNGFRVNAFKCDVNDSSAVDEVFSKLQYMGCVVKGVIQCAMVLEDSIFDNMTFEQWTRASRPKIQGTMNLHRASVSQPLSFFILLSSITCVMGNPAQSNYAAGNTFEDAVANWRRQVLGLPATAIDVGLVSDSAHFAGADFDMDAYLAMYSHGWEGAQCTEDELSSILEAAMRGSTSDGQSLPPQVVLGLGDGLARDGAMADQWTRDRKFDHRVGTSLDGETGGNMGVKECLSKAGSIGEATAAVEIALKEQIAVSMAVLPDEVDTEKPLYDYGVDSLKAVEMRNRIFRTMQSDISVFEILSPTPLGKLAIKIAARSTLLSPVVAEEAAKEASD